MTRRIRAAKWLPEIEQFEALFGSLEPGERLTYAQLSEAVGFAVTSQTYPLRVALRRLTKRGIWIYNIPEVGYERLTDEKAFREAAPREVRNVSRRAQRARDRLLTIDERRLSRQEVVTHWARIAGVTAAAQVTSTRSIKALERRDNATIIDGLKRIAHAARAEVVGTPEG